MIQETLFRIAGFAYFWSLCHDVSIKALEVLLSLCAQDYHAPQGIKTHIDALKAEALATRAGARRLGNMKRLVRSEIYCLFAASAGMYVFYTEYKDFPMDLLHHWGPYHSYLFEIACGHWLFSLIEDYLVGEEVIAHVIPLQDERPELYGWMLNGLLVHHVITAFAYSWCLATHKLGGLCIFGLMFETPILLLNVRDLWACFEKEFMSPLSTMSKQGVSTFVGSMYFLWHVFRTIPCFLYPLSILIWRPELNTLSIHSRVVYHFLGLLFCYVNFELIFSIIPRVMLDDWMRAKLMSPEAHLHSVRVMTGEIDETGRVLKKKKKKEDEYVVDVENQQKESKVGLQMMGLEAMSKHNSAEDCWVAIDGNVYDLTDFASKHPGGSAVILDVAGKEASNEFLAAGHSMKARKMMTKYMVGHILSRAYEQKDDVPLDPNMRGDLSKPFEVGRMYLTYDNSSISTFFITSAAVLFLQHASYQLGVSQEESNIFLFYGNVSSALPPIMALLVVSILTSLVLNKFSVYASRTMEGQLGITAPLRSRAFLSLFADWRTHLSSIIFLLYLLSDFVIFSIKYGHALRAMRVSILITCTLELTRRTYIGPVTLPRTTTLYKILLTFIPVVCLVTASGIDLSCTSRYINRAYRHHTEEGVAEALDINNSLFALVIFGSACMRFFFVRSLEAPRNEKLDFNLTFSRHVLTLMYAGMIMCFWPSEWFPAHQSAAPTTVDSVASIGITCLGVRFVCGVSMALMLGSMSKLVSTTTCHFSSQTYCIWLVFILWACAPPVGSARWVCFFLFMVAMKSLSFEADVTLDIYGGDAPDWVYQAKQIENVIRHNISLAIHSFITMPLNGVNSFIAPKSQMYFAYAGPVMDLGPDCEYGMCYQINPSPQQKPETFQVNVGYIGDQIGDYMHTATATKNMMQGLVDDKEAGKKGFVTNLVAHFFLPDKSPARKFGNFRIREVNMSGWASDKAAHDWYLESGVHKEIVKKYYGGGLEGFSAMLATLKPPPDRPIRWDVRCRKCRFVVKGPDPGLCPHCNEPVPPMPYF